MGLKVTHACAQTITRKQVSPPNAKVFISLMVGDWKACREMGDDVGDGVSVVGADAQTVCV